MANPCTHAKVSLETLCVDIDRQWIVAARTWVCNDCGAILRQLSDMDIFREGTKKRSTIKPVTGVGKYD